MANKQIYEIKTKNHLEQPLDFLNGKQRCIGQWEQSLTLMSFERSEYFYRCNPDGTERVEKVQTHIGSG